MFRSRFLSILLALLMLTCMFSAYGEEDFYDEFMQDLIVENVPPSEPVIVEGEFIRVTSEYLPEEEITRYTAQLTGNPAFEDGAAITAKDLLFSLYVYLDPGYSGGTELSSLPVLGLKNYRAQVSDERLSAAAETMQVIEAAGKNHVLSDSDSWTQELQDAYWTLRAEYLAACEAEFPACAQAIVDYCDLMLASDPQGAFGRTPEEILADDGLRVAYAMLQWGYARAVDSAMTFRESGKIWYLETEKPTVADFAEELSLAYDGDLSACWTVEGTGTYEPALPSVEEAFLQRCIGDAKDSVLSVSGIRMPDETTVEIDLPGIEMGEAHRLFGFPVLSLSGQGDAGQWSPETGLYGHPFGDVSSITSFDGPVLLDVSDEILF